MTAGVQEHGTTCLSCTLEETACDHTAGNHEDGAGENSHGLGGHFLHLQISRSEGRHKCLGLPLEQKPGQHHKYHGVKVGELYHALDAGVELCSIIVTHNGLGPVHKTKQRHNDDGYNAVQNTEGGNCHIATGHGCRRFQTLVSVGGQAPGENSVHQAVANLHDGRRQTQNVDLADIGPAQLHVASVDLDRGSLLQEKVGNQNTADQLGADGCPGGSLDTPVQSHNKDIVQNHVGCGTDDFSEHGGLGVAHGTDKVVHAGSHRLENCTQQDNAHVAGGHRQGLVAGAEQAQQRFHKDFAEGKGTHCHDDQQYEGVVQDNGRLLVLLFAQSNGKEGVGAHAHDHGHGHDEQGDGEA